MRTYMTKVYSPVRHASIMVLTMAFLTMLSYPMPPHEVAGYTAGSFVVTFVMDMVMNTDKIEKMREDDHEES